MRAREQQPAAVHYSASCSLVKSSQSDLVFANLQPDRGATVPVPDLYSVNPMPLRNLALFQQKIDSSRRRSLPSPVRISERLSVVPAFGVCLEP